MGDEIDNLVKKLRDIEEQARMIQAEVPMQGLPLIRLRQIIVLAKYVRLRMEGQSAAFDSLLQSEPSGDPARKPEPKT